MATFVLVHGAFRGGWSFARLRPLLAARGHAVFTPSLPGAAEHAPRAGANVTPPSLLDYAESVARLLVLEDLRDVVLVGHSQGGLVIQAASQLAHERIGHLVFLDAPIPAHGERGVDMVAPGFANAPRPTLTPDLVLPPRPLAEGAGMSPADAAWINERLTPQPLRPSLEPLELTAPEALGLRRSYLFCRLTPDTYPCAHGRARLDAHNERYEWLDAGHDAPTTAPAVVAEALLRALQA